MPHFRDSDLQLSRAKNVAEMTPSSFCNVTGKLFSLPGTSHHRTLMIRAILKKGTEWSVQLERICYVAEWISIPTRLSLWVGVARTGFLQRCFRTRKCFNFPRYTITGFVHHFPLAYSYHGCGLTRIGFMRFMSWHDWCFPRSGPPMPSHGVPLHLSLQLGRPDSHSVTLHI